VKVQLLPFQKRLLIAWRKRVLARRLLALIRPSTGANPAVALSLPMSGQLDPGEHFRWHHEV